MPIARHYSERPTKSNSPQRYAISASRLRYPINMARLSVGYEFRQERDLSRANHRTAHSPCRIGLTRKWQTLLPFLTRLLFCTSIGRTSMPLTHLHNIVKAILTTTPKDRRTDIFWISTSKYIRVPSNVTHASCSNIVKTASTVAAKPCVSTFISNPTNRQQLSARAEASAAANEKKIFALISRKQGTKTPVTHGSRHSSHAS